MKSGKGFKQRVARPAEPLSLESTSLGLGLGSWQETQRFLGLPGPREGSVSTPLGLCVLAHWCVLRVLLRCPWDLRQRQNEGGP